MTGVILFSFNFSVELMEKRLDSENLGIILLKDFMDEFFPEEKRSTPDTFTVWHYNGLAKSSPDNKVECHIFTVNQSLWDKE